MIEKTQAYIKADAVETAYTQLPNTYDVKGEVVEVEGKNLKVNLEEGQVVEVVLKAEIENIEVGQEVSIPRELIRRTRIIKEDEFIEDNKEEIERFEQLLKTQDIKLTKENLEIAKTLEKNNIKPTKENIQSMKLMIDSVKDLKVELNYEILNRLENKLQKSSIDIMEIPIAKLSEEVKSIKQNLEEIEISSKVSKGKTEISWDQARDIAKSIYGVEMGKDILDIIRTLKKENIEVTKSKIDEIHDLFSKVDNIKKVEKDVFAEVIKREMDLTIDNVYNIKNYVVKSQVEIVETLNGEEKIYLNNLFNKTQAKQVQKELPKLFQMLNIEETKDTKNAAMAIISRGEEITKEKIEVLVKYQEDTVNVLKTMNYASGAKISIENEELAKLKISSLKMKLEEIGDIKNTFIKTISKDENKPANNIEVSDLEEVKIVKLDTKGIVANILKDKFDDIKTIIKNIDKEQDFIFTTILKSGKQLTLGEMKRVSDFMKNKSGIGSIIEKFISEVKTSNDKPVIKLAEEVKEVLKNMPEKVYKGREEVNKDIKETENIIREIKKTVEQKNEKVEKSLEILDKDIKQTYQEQRKIIENNFHVIQIPFYFGEEGGNAQAFIEKKSSNKKIDPSNMTMIVNIKVGEIDNIRFDVSTKEGELTVNINTENEKLKKFVDKNMKSFLEKMQSIELDVKKENTEKKESVKTSFIDIKL